LSPFAVVVTRLTTTRDGGAKALLQGLTVPEPRLFQKKAPDCSGAFFGASTFAVGTRYQANPLSMSPSQIFQRGWNRGKRQGKLKHGIRRNF
jgi:hypothetical protein